MTTTHTMDALLQTYVGREAEPPRLARYPVNAAMISNWVEAHDDNNPVYIEAEAARMSGRSDIICPPAMISTWVMSGYRRYRNVQRMRVEGQSKDFAYSELMSLPDHRRGTALPTLEVPVDRTTIVVAAIASQDFEDVHHDPGKAANRGTPDIFMSINSTNGFVDRYITDWAGPSARITRVSLRLGVPMFAGDTLTLAGEVVDDTDGATIKITGSNSRGVHVSGEVHVDDHQAAAS